MSNPFDKAKKKAERLARKAKEKAEREARKARDTAQDAGKIVEDTAQDAEQLLEKQVSNSIEKLGDSIKSGVREVGQRAERDVKEASDKAGRGIRHVGSEVEDQVNKAGQTAVHEVEAAAKKGAHAAEKAVEKALDKALALTARQAFDIAIKVIKVAAPSQYTASLGPVAIDIENIATRLDVLERWRDHPPRNKSDLKEVIITLAPTRIHLQVDISLAALFVQSDALSVGWHGTFETQQFLDRYDELMDLLEVL